MQLIEVLVRGPRCFRGQGVNHQQQVFTGELRLQVLAGGQALLLHYTATLESGEVVHEEHTLLGAAADGTACLWPVMSELPVVLPHRAITAVAATEARVAQVFASGARDDAASFREEITIAIDADGALTYAHAWAMPGGAFDDRSPCRMLPAELQP